MNISRQILCAFTFLGIGLLFVRADDGTDLVNAINSFSSTIITNAPGLNANALPVSTAQQEQPTGANSPTGNAAGTSKKANSATGNAAAENGIGYAPAEDPGLFLIKKGLIMFAVSAFVVVTVAGIRSFMKVGAKMAEKDFIRQFGGYSHACVLNDPHSFAKGKVKLEYPALRVGEFKFDINGSTIVGENLLQLRNEVILKFYVDNTEEMEDHSYVRRPFNVQKVEKVGPKRSIFE